MKASLTMENPKNSMIRSPNEQRFIGGEFVVAGSVQHNLVAAVGIPSQLSTTSKGTKQISNRKGPHSSSEKLLVGTEKAAVSMESTTWTTQINLSDNFRNPVTDSACMLSLRVHRQGIQILLTLLNGRMHADRHFQALKIVKIAHKIQTLSHSGFLGSATLLIT